MGAERYRSQKLKLWRSFFPCTKEFLSGFYYLSCYGRLHGRSFLRVRPTFSLLDPAVVQTDLHRLLRMRSRS